MARKTFSVKELIGTVNHRNRVSTCSEDTRRGWNSILADILHKTGNYQGFGYLEQHEVPEGQKPGIIKGEGDQPHQFPDESRVFYYQSFKLR